MFYLYYAYRSLLERKRQYCSLFLVCAVAVGIIFTVIITTDGMFAALSDKAKLYYGGELQFSGGTDDDDSISPEQTKTLVSVMPDYVKVHQRFDYAMSGSDISLYFEGARVHLRILKGLDFNNETELIDKFTFAERSAIEAAGLPVVMVSLPVAKKLGAHVGDAVTVSLRTREEYTNTMTFMLAGIFQDSSAFGMYTGYIGLEVMRKITDFADDYINILGIHKPAGDFTKKEIDFIQRRLESVFNMSPIPSDKWAFRDIRDDSLVPIYALITLTANNEELSLITAALRTVMMLVIVPLLLIVAIGIGSSYRVIVLKRTTETGTFRAIGLRPSGVIKLFMTEAFLLLVAGFAAGMVLSFLLSHILSLFNFSFIPAFDMFLQGGHLIAVVRFSKGLILLLAIFVTTLCAVLFTVRNLMHVSPVYALGTTV